MTKIKMGLRVAARRAGRKNKGRKRPLSAERLIKLLQYARRPKKC